MNEIEPYSYCDSREYKEFVERTAKVVTKRRKLAEIRKALGPGYDERWNLIDVLNDGKFIEPVRFSARLEWQPAPTPRDDKVEWNGTRKRKSDA